MSEFLVPIVAVFMVAVLLNASIFSCVCISIQRGKKLEVLGTMDNFFYMKTIRRLLVLSSIFLLIECIGFLVHYSFHNQTTNTHFNTILIAINTNITTMDNEPLYLSDFMIYFGFLLFLLCCVGAYYIALHRFLLTNQQSKARYDSQTYLHIICIACYITISLTAITFSVINLFIAFNLYYILLICFDIQLLLSSIPVLKSLKQVIEISRDSAKSVRWSVTNVSPSKLFYKMSVKAVRMSMENIILNILLIADISFNAYQIIQTPSNIHRNGAIPHNIHSAHLFILYFIQLFMILWLNDYAWINRKYITVRKTTTHHHSAPKRHVHTRTNFSDFDYNNTVLHLKRAVTPSCPLSVKDPEIVQLKAAPPQKSDEKSDVSAIQPADEIDELQFLKLSDKIKLRSISLTSSTYHSKRKVNKEFLTKKASFESSTESKDCKVSKRRRSVLSRIPDAAKRMSRSFVGAVIAVDSIWDEPEQDIGDGTRRWSRYNKQPKPSTSSRRHSMPSNASPKTTLRRNSLTLKANIPVFTAPSASSPICSPLSQLDASDHRFASFPRTAKLQNITERTVNTVPQMAPMANSQSLQLTLQISNTVSTMASPKTYSQRNQSTYSDPPSSLSDITAKTDNNSSNANAKRQKFFTYNHKLLLTDRISGVSESPSLTPQTATCTEQLEVMELSRLSDLSEGSKAIEMKTDVINMRTVEEESKTKQSTAKDPQSQMVPCMETCSDANATVYNIETSIVSEIETGFEDREPHEGMERNIVIVINDDAIRKSNTKANTKDTKHKDDEDNEHISIHPLPQMASLDFDEDEMDNILQCIDEYQ